MILQQDIERLESVGAGFSASVGGLLAYIPQLLTTSPNVSQFLIQSGLTGIECSLFGIVYRYAVRKDIENIFLKVTLNSSRIYIKFYIYEIVYRHIFMYKLC